ncbi:hypothetical protein ACPCTO_34055 [Streptomyces olivoreticuli]
MMVRQLGSARWRPGATARHPYVKQRDVGGGPSHGGRHVGTGTDLGDDLGVESESERGKAPQRADRLEMDARHRHEWISEVRPPGDHRR